MSIIRTLTLQPAPHHHRCAICEKNSSLRLCMEHDGQPNPQGVLSLCEPCALELADTFAKWRAFVDSRTPNKKDPRYSRGFADGAMAVTTVGLDVLHGAFKVLVRSGKKHEYKPEDLFRDECDELLNNLSHVPTRSSDHD